jgi:hypothetical protein
MDTSAGVEKPLLHLAGTVPLLLQNTPIKAHLEQETEENGSHERRSTILLADSHILEN